mgnify:CR=1 FL=1
MNITKLLRLLLLCLVIGLASWGVMLILDREPPARVERPQAALPLVEVLAAQPGSHAISSSVHGTISAMQALHVRPEVGGRLLGLHPAFEPGGLIPAGETLFELDPTDYELQVSAAEAALARARAEVEIEQGRRKVASEELRLLQDSITIDEASRELALRAPQLKQVRAGVMQAQNALEEAQIRLQRTAGRFAHDVVVLSRDKVPGEILAARDSIGRVARADRFWAELQVPLTLLPRLCARTATQAGSRVEILSQGHVYPAEVTRIRAELSDTSRLAGVLTEIEDPLGRLPPNRDRPPLLIGSYIEARVDAGTLDNAVAVPRSALQDNSRIWVVDENDRLTVRTVAPLYLGPDLAYLAPLGQGERILLGNPAGLVPGGKVRTGDSP